MMPLGGVSAPYSQRGDAFPTLLKKLMPASDIPACLSHVRHVVLMCINFKQY